MKNLTETLKDWVMETAANIDLMVKDIGPIQANTPEDETAGRIPAYRKGYQMGRQSAITDVSAIISRNDIAAPDLSDVKAKHSALLGALDATIDDTTVVDQVRQAAWALLTSLNQVYGRQPSPNAARNASPSVEIDITKPIIGVPADSDLGRKIADSRISQAIEYGCVVKETLLSRIEGFLSELVANDAQPTCTALLRDLRDIMGKMKPFTVIGMFDDGSHLTDHVEGVDADDAWNIWATSHTEADRVAVFPGHLKEE